MDAELAAIVQSSDDAIIGKDLDGTILSWNPGAERIYGYRAEEVVGKSISLLVPPDKSDELTDMLARLKRGEGVDHMETVRLRKDGRRVDLSMTISPIRDAEGALIGASTIARDITARKATDEALRHTRARLTAAFDHAPIGMALVSISADSCGRFLEVNPALCKLTGHSRERLLTMTFESLTHPADNAEDLELMRQLREGEIPGYELEKRLVHADREVSWVMLHASLVSDDSDAPLYCIHQLQDIEGRKRFEVELGHLADHDPLTGLFNRRRFARELSREISGAARYGGGGALFILDVDNFKQINDTLGHNAGDEVMMAVAHLLRERLRETDVLARLGGDEFAVLLPRAGTDEAKAVAGGLLDTLRGARIAVGGEGPTRLTVSIGMASFDSGKKTTPEDIMIDADVAMYDAKQQGRDRSAFASREQRQRMMARQDWTQRIRQALDDDLFVLYCQPILDLQSGTISQHELLLRMPGDHDELILPAAFLYTAERYGFIRAIDRWVLGRAIRLLAEHKNGRDLRLEVNISGPSVTDPDLPAFVEQELHAESIDPANLILEVTETAAIANMAQARRFVARLTDIGCGFALDDFGAGFGSFYYLKHLPFDYLKIDGEFIQNLANSTKDQQILKSIVEMAEAFGKRTIAEFVGDEESVQLLREQHVDYAQGYHVGRPRPLSQIGEPVNGHPADDGRSRLATQAGTASAP